MTNYYEVLGIENFAPFADVKMAYRRRSKQWHPDLHNGSAIYTEKFKELQEAYSCLNDDDKRARYDERLRAFLKGSDNDAQESTNYTYTYQAYTEPPYTQQKRKAPVISNRTFYRFLWPFVFIAIRMAACNQNEPNVPAPFNEQIDVQSGAILDSLQNKNTGDTLFDHVTPPVSPFLGGKNK